MLDAKKVYKQRVDASKGVDRLRKRRCRKFIHSATIPVVIIFVIFYNVYPNKSRPSKPLQQTSQVIPPLPIGAHIYYLLDRRQASPDTCLLRFGLPKDSSTLRLDTSLPTCIKVTMPGGTDVYGDGIPTSMTDLSKSYSPISHPSTEGTFDLIVKAYPTREGGGVGSFLCALQPENNGLDENTSVIDTLNAATSIVASLKKPRRMFESPHIYKRWRHVGLVAGGTGIAPLFQIAVMLLNESTNYTTDISLISFNRHIDDILLRDELKSMVKESGGRFRVTFSITSPTVEKKHDAVNSEIEYGRGSVDMVQRTLPPPANGDDSTVILVCGTDGFVEWWGGPIGRGPKKPDGSKGPKIQGPLLGILGRAGYVEKEVFKY